MNRKPPVTPGLRHLPWSSFSAPFVLRSLARSHLKSRVSSSLCDQAQVPGCQTQLHRGQFNLTPQPLLHPPDASWIATQGVRTFICKSFFRGASAAVLAPCDRFAIASLTVPQLCRLCARRPLVPSKMLNLSVFLPLSCLTLPQMNPLLHSTSEKNCP